MTSGLLSCFIVFNIMESLVSSAYVLDNNKNIRIVSNEEYCDQGRIEFYYGTGFGSYVDCNHVFNMNYANSICNNLGWDKALLFSVGKHNLSVSNAVYIAYTNIECDSNDCNNDIWNVNECSDICSECLFTKDINTDCPTKIDIQDNYEVYIECGNKNVTNKYSQKYQCNYYNYTDLYTYTNNINHINSFQNYSNETYQSCDYTEPNNDEPESKSRIAKILIMIFAIFVAVMCMYVYCTSRNASKRKVRKTFVDDDGMEDVDMRQIGVGNGNTSLQAGKTKGNKNIVEDYERM